MIHVNCRSILGMFVDVESLGATRLCKSHLKASLSTLLLIIVFSLLYFPYGDDVNARCILYHSINEMPAPDAVFVFIKISFQNIL